MHRVPVEISARHLHLSQNDLETLFGPGYKLSKINDLSQPGEFAARETVQLIGPKASYEAVRVVGPVRRQTQVEITATDGRFLGIKAPVKLSGKLKGSAGAILQGPKGRVGLKEGVIVPKRHLHLSTDQAKSLRLKNNQKVALKLAGERAVVFSEVVVRAGEHYRLSCHLDTDEANAAGLKSCGYGELII
ncbi:MAG: propanediol utilization protein [Candidatus Komeilibacteria bacterium RIFOXYA2_FULL_45_9]|nr:MAG: propanediol utilization protein [Candidatus Komeilibacteria bacterium RIFOXYA2_FULL_45_9]